MQTFRKDVQDRYGRAAFVAHGRTVTQKPANSEMLFFSLLAVAGTVATFAAVWVLV